MKHDYVCTELFTEEECLKIRDKFFENLNPNLKDVPAEGVTKTSDVYFANLQNMKEILHKANQFALNVNKTYFGYDLHETTDHDVLFLNAYDANKHGQYGWHKDVTQDVDNFDFKLTMLINISDNYYETGHLRMFTTDGDRKIAEFEKPGMVIVFPSFIPHCVSNVTLGVRKTITQFFVGPKFR